MSGLGGVVGSTPRIDVLVAVHNEGFWLERKLDDLEALEYPPARLGFWLIDGASEDDSLAIARARADRDPRYRVIRWPSADKVAQLNAALRRSRAEWLLVTDADARLPRDLLFRLLAEAARVPGTSVVGATVRPAASHPLEALHWRMLNRITRWEACVASSSIVTAPCYLFRRETLSRFPSDVVADDIHVAFAARSRGMRVGMIQADVVEMRSPVSLPSLFRHKLRKGRAYLREVVRFLPHLRRFKGRDRLLFMVRAGQMLVVPTAFALAAAAVAMAAGRSALGGSILLVGATGLLLLFGFQAARNVVSHTDPTIDGRGFGGRVRAAVRFGSWLVDGISLVLLLMCVLLLASVWWIPRRRRTRSPRRVAEWTDGWRVSPPAGA